MTAQLAPTPVFKAFDNNGEPLAGGLLYTYIAGTSTPQATYKDSTLGSPNTNPVVLNARGECALWLDPTLAYKFQLTDSLGNTIPGYPVDNIPGGIAIGALTGSLVPAVDNTYNLGSITNAWAQLYLGVNHSPVLDLITGNVGFYARTPAEITASVTPTNYSYAPGRVDRYGTNTTPGTTSMTAAFQAAINQARVGGADVTWGATAPYVLDAVLDCTFGTTAKQFGITFRQIGIPGVNLPANTSGGILVTHNNYAVFDLTGCSFYAFYDLTLITNSSNYPQTCFLTARNSHGESNFPRFFNTKVVGYFSVAILYNYGSEDGTYFSNVWENSATDTGACAVVITANNLFKGSAAFMSSSFVTIFTGSASTIRHSFEGGDYALINTSTTGDVFYIEGGIDTLRLNGCWVDNSNPNGTTHGRSFFYADMTNGAPLHVQLNSIRGENSATVPVYGIDFSTDAFTAIGWSIRDCFFPTTTFAINSAGASTLLSTFYVSNLTEATSKGINVTGTLEDSTIDFTGLIVLGTSLRNLLITNFANLTVSVRTNDIILDRGTGGTYLRGSLGLWGNAPAAQLAGWGTPTAGSVVNNFPGSGASTAQCGSVLTELIIQLKALGLLSA